MSLKKPSKGEQQMELIVRLYRLPEPKREYVFTPLRRFRLDFAWPDKKIFLEVEGGVWRKGGGAHSHPTNIIRDIQKHNLLTVLGWRGLRKTTDDVMNEPKVVVDELKQLGI